MLILTPTEASQAIGAACGGSSPSATDPQLLRILSYLTPRVEGAMNVDSLRRRHYEDSFRVVCSTRSTSPNKLFRLSNGYIVKDTLSVTSPSGTVTLETSPEVIVGYEEGTVEMPCTESGKYIIGYYSGFEVENMPDPVPFGFEDEFRAFIGVPQWMKALAATYLIRWYRTVQLSPKANTDISFASISKDLDREIYSRVYSTYMRPRVDVVFADRRANIVPEPTP